MVQYFVFVSVSVLSYVLIFAKSWKAREFRFHSQQQKYRSNLTSQRVNLV